MQSPRMRTITRRSAEHCELHLQVNRFALYYKCLLYIFFFYTYSLALGRLRHALDAFRHAETLATRPDAEIFYHIGDLLLRKGEPNSDEQPHETAANRKASIAKDATIVGTALPALNADVVEAKQYFMKSIQNDNRQVLSFRKLSAIFVRERDYPRAIEMLESVVQTLPENVEILTEVGCLYLLVNNTKSAFDRLHEAMKLNERYTRALLALGAIYQV